MKLFRNLAFPIIVLGAALLSAAIVRAAPNSLLILPGSNSQFSSQIRPAPAYVDARVLAANVAEAQTVPAGARWVLFSSSCNFYANPSAAAAVPAADVTDGSASELNPAAWQLPSTVISISVIAGAACVVTMSFYN